MKYFLIGFVAIAFVLECVGFLTHSSILGLFLDIVGAYFLAQAFVIKKVEEIISESWGDEGEKYPGGLSENLGISLYAQSIDARTGFIVLMLGFVLQGIGNLYPNLKMPSFIGFFFITAILLMIYCIHKKMKNPKRINNILSKKMAEMSKK